MGVPVGSGPLLAPSMVGASATGWVTGSGPTGSVSPGVACGAGGNGGVVARMPRVRDTGESVSARSPCRDDGGRIVRGFSGRGLGP